MQPYMLNTVYGEQVTHAPTYIQVSHAAIYVEHSVHNTGYPPAETVAPEKQARANQLEVILEFHTF